jgi:multiple sugar transport system permease protein
MSASKPNLAASKPAVHLKRSARDRLINAVVFVILIPVVMVWIAPLLLMISTSFKDQAQLFDPTKLIPSPVFWDNYYKAIFTFLPFPTFFRNSLIVSSLVVLGDIFAASFVGYGFARLRFPGRDFLFLVMLSTMMIPYAVTMIPLFLVFKEFGWLNTFMPLTVPSFFGNPLFIFLVRQFYMTIPHELSDAARVDGANELQIWWRIMLPLSRPVLAVIAIMAFQQSWNDFLAPLIYLNKTDMFTATLGLYKLIGGLDSIQPWQYLMAATLVTISPLLLVFFFAQRYFVQGISVTGVKG